MIAKTEEVVEKELLIQEKEKLYLELKHILARQPGPEVAEQLAIYQQTLKEKTKQMKVGCNISVVLFMSCFTKLVKLKHGCLDMVEWLMACIVPSDHCSLYSYIYVL